MTKACGSIGEGHNGGRRERRRSKAFARRVSVSEGCKLMEGLQLCRTQPGLPATFSAPMGHTSALSSSPLFTTIHAAIAIHLPQSLLCGFFARGLDSLHVHPAARSVYSPLPPPPPSSSLFALHRNPSLPFPFRVHHFK